MKIERETVDGREVFAWSVGDKGGYCASVEDAASDASKFDDGPVPHPDRQHLSGCQQYLVEVYFQGQAERSNREPFSGDPFSEWYPTDAGAVVGMWADMEGQGYEVHSVEIGFPCKVTLLAPEKARLS